MTAHRIKPPEGSWTYWLDDGADSGVWPVKVHAITPFGVSVEGTNPHGPYFGEKITVALNRVYDGKFNRPTLEKS